MTELVKTLSGIFDNFGVIAGLLILLIGALCFVSYKILMHFLRQNTQILNMAMEMNAKWQKVIDDITNRQNDFSSQVREAHNYQREEHNEMLRGLQDVCSISKVNGECLSEVRKGLEETNKSLIRINGYKHG